MECGPLIQEQFEAAQPRIARRLTELTQKSQENVEPQAQRVETIQAVRLIKAAFSRQKIPCRSRAFLAVRLA